MTTYQQALAAAEHQLFGHRTIPAEAPGRVLTLAEVAEAAALDALAIRLRALAVVSDIRVAEEILTDAANALSDSAWDIRNNGGSWGEDE